MMVLRWMLFTDLGGNDKIKMLVDANIFALTGCLQEELQ
ncbi:hypothetical protein DESME_12190 [Desulfitobacterium metallireducens DSM 15288]|uniref:Uncharacterized protein n=1 Tax=Desulfitobacterium metallireducens DSM 15288 TaxID=871968 RepID=W0EHW5_9FIRM|nr:hypothetical protein DESME_12190 [Desulfitobacterium metallireducens DSM 15288]